MEKHLCVKNVNDLHQEPGHPSEASTRAMGPSMQIKLVGSLNQVKLACWEKQSSKTSTKQQ